MKPIKMVRLAFMSTLIFIIAPAIAAERMDADNTMTMADKNMDSRIDREEFHRRMTEVFFFADNDKDGKLTFAEFVFVEKIDPMDFNRADRDRDGKLSLYEFVYALHYDFDTADKNQDGVIDLQELKNLMGK